MKRQKPVEINRVMYYPVWDANHLLDSFAKQAPMCLGCVTANSSGTRPEEPLCRALNESCDGYGCKSIIWKTGDEGLAIWTAERLTE